MNSQGPSVNSETQSEEENDMRRGPWTIEEDRMLVNYISKHGEGRWNSLARCAGLKRTGKSCRLRWLNYLRPDVRRGNITPEEQLLILQLHSRWGNRWSKIAQNLPGRTDNEIKNYWRTRVEKHAKQLKCDVNSKQFKDAMRYVWMPRLVERIQAAASSRTGCNDMPQPHSDSDLGCVQNHEMITQEQYYRSTTGGCASSSDSPSVDTTQNQMVCADHPVIPENNNTSNNYYHNFQTSSCPETLLNVNGSDFSVTQLDGWFGTGGDPSENACWSMDDFWLLEQQLCSGL